MGEYEKRLIRPQLVVSGTYGIYDRGSLRGYASNSPEDVMDWSDKTFKECDIGTCDPPIALSWRVAAVCCSGRQKQG